MWSVSYKVKKSYRLNWSIIFFCNFFRNFYNSLKLIKIYWEKNIFIFLWWMKWMGQHIFDEWNELLKKNFPVISKKNKKTVVLDIPLMNEMNRSVYTWWI